MAQLNAASNILNALKDPYLIITPDQTIKRVNNWGQLVLPHDAKLRDVYPEFLGYKEIMEAIADLETDKNLINIRLNDSFISGVYNITIVLIAADRILILLTRSELIELNGNLVSLSNIIEMRDAFTASIGHELRTPLTSILSMVELMGLTELTSKQRDYMKFLNNSSIQLVAIINDILDYNRLETNNVKLEHNPVNLRHCIDSAVSIVAADFASVTLNYPINIMPGTPIDVMADESKIIQILINLVKNSAKFSPNEGKITVNLRVEEQTEKSSRQKYIFEVIDQGVGIAPTDIDKLFVPYLQLNKDESRRRHGGTGLGLIISKRLCNLMGGTISVQSELGKGTKMTFTLILDVAPKQSRHMSASNEIMGLMHDKNVLIVDDNESYRITLMQIVNSWGANATCCSSAAEALAVLEMRAHKQTNSKGSNASPGLIPGTPRQIGYQLAILDYCMPGMNGRDLAIEIKKRDFDFPIIILSSLNESITGPFVLSYKPINKRSIEELVKSVLTPVVSMQSVREPIRNTDKILVVDDHEGIRFSIIESLHYIGYVNIDQAINGDEATRYVDRAFKSGEHYKYIFMDIIMPVRGGVEATLDINKIYQSCMQLRPFIIALTANVSSVANETKYARPENGAMNAYLAKPISIDKLRNILKK